MNPTLFSTSTRSALKSMVSVQAVLLCVLQLGLPLASFATGVPNPNPTPYSVVPGNTRLTGEVSVAKDIRIAPDSAKVSMKFRDTPVRDILNSLAKQGGFNIMIDAEVKSTLTVDISNVSINKALNYIFQMGELSYTQDSNTLLVASNKTINAREMNAKTFKTIPVKYRDASAIATTLNATLFRLPRAGAAAKSIASFDADSNSLIVMGGDSDVVQVESALKILDVPRERRVYRIQHGDPAFVMAAVASTLFPSSQSSGGGESGGSGGESGGGESGGGAAAGGAAGGGGSGGSSGGDSFVSAGFSMVSNKMNGSLTVSGTPELMELADKVIRENDVLRPQVMIEVALVEMSKTNDRTWSINGGASSTSPSINSGEFSAGILGTAGSLSLRRVPALLNSKSGGSRFPNVGLDITNKNASGKVLANPTIIALDGSTSKVDITDQIVYFVTQVQTASGISTETTTVNTVDVGVKLDITPVVSNDGMVHLTMNPKVTELTAMISGPAGMKAPQTATRSIELQNVRVRDGETLVIGGLLQNKLLDSADVVPGLGNLPIIGAMFRNSTTTNTRNELVVMVTPHILRDADTTPYYFDGNGVPLQAEDHPRAEAFYNGMVRQRTLPKLVDTQSLSPAMQPFETDGSASVTTGRLDLRQAFHARSASEFPSASETTEARKAAASEKPKHSPKAKSFHSTDNFDALFHS